jgi:glycopeptide antibiotics resistance protein
MPTLDFFPYPLMFGLTIVSLALMRARRRAMPYRLTVGLFGIYLLAVVNLVAFPIVLYPTWPAYTTWDAFAFTLTRMVNLIPLNYGSMFSDLSAGRLAPAVVFWEIFGNILLTVPFGVFASLLFSLPGRRVLWLALWTGLALEGIQLLILVLIGPSMHSFDINDVLLNAVGVLVGHGLYRAAVWGFHRIF